MNTANNKRRKASRKKIEKVFTELLQKKELSQITVSEIIKITGLNRTTFYANYADIYALADCIRDNLSAEVERMYAAEDSSLISYNWLKLFEHIKDNQLFYKTYFKLGYDKSPINISDLKPIYREVFPQSEMPYHIEFFKAGFNAIVKMWLSGGCKESPEEMNRILISEYSRQK